MAPHGHGPKTPTLVPETVTICCLTHSGAEPYPDPQDLNLWPYL